MVLPSLACGFRPQIYFVCSGYDGSFLARFPVLIWENWVYPPSPTPLNGLLGAGFTKRARKIWMAKNLEVKGKYPLKSSIYLVSRDRAT
jgi:hypothetical protein